MQEFARNIARVSKESKLEINEEDYVASFKVGLMDAVHSWCRGAKFSEICKVSIYVSKLPHLNFVSTADCGLFRTTQMSDVFEGSLIRVFRRLQELLRQMAMAAKVTGFFELEEKFMKSLEMLERKSSIIFSPSLYL